MRAGSPGRGREEEVKAGEMTAGVPAIVVAGADGTVVSQNAVARVLMGASCGGTCQNAMGALEDAKELPCARGCVQELLSSGLDRPRHTRISLKGRRHHLTCVPLDGIVVCILSPSGGSLPESWQWLTAREWEVLRLLAEGATTPSLATRLGISESTVSTHVEHMRGKLGASTRAALVALGFQLGFLD